MKNEVKINRLLKYDVYPFNYGGENPEAETFTADNYTVDPQTNSVRFYRTGNLIREYFGFPQKIVATPVDEA